MHLGDGYTIEEQMTGHAKQGGIQIDVFPSLNESVRFRTELQGSIWKRSLTASHPEISGRSRWEPDCDDDVTIFTKPMKDSLLTLQ